MVTKFFFHYFNLFFRNAHILHQKTSRQNFGLYSFIEKWQKVKSVMLGQELQASHMQILQEDLQIQTTIHTEPSSRLQQPGRPHHKRKACADERKHLTGKATA
jgi:hypothetical protein